VGTTLGKHGVNIARLSVGRKNGQALAIVEVDGDISAAVLGELKKIPAVQRVKQVKVL
jgi:D-3-phosphoglycerate dehydrogenase